MARDVDGDKSTHFLGKFRAGGFRLAALHGSRDKTVPTASFGTIFGDPRAGTVETQQFVDAQYERTLASRWHAGARVYYDRYAYDGTYPYPGDEEGGAPSSVLNLDFARGNRWGAEVTLRKRVAQRHTLAVGSEYRRNFRQDQYNYDVNPYHQYLDDRRSSTNWAVYVQDEMKLHERLLVNLGLRHDQYDTFGGTTNPRAALIYTPASRTTLKLLYGQAFRAPNAYELFWRQDDVAKANPVLRPETNSTSEFVLEQALTSAVRVGVTAFHYRVDDLISQQTDPFDDLLVYNNVDRIDARGLELEAEGKWSSGLLARTSYTYQNSRNHATHQPLTNSPAHVAPSAGAGAAGTAGIVRRVRDQLSERTADARGEPCAVHGARQSHRALPASEVGHGDFGEPPQPVRRARRRPGLRGTSPGQHHPERPHVPRQRALPLLARQVGSSRP